MVASRLYWVRSFIEGHLAIMPAPQLEAVEGTVLHWKEEGVDIVVCLLESTEIAGLVRAEKGLCEELGLEFLWFPIKERSVPPLGAEFDALMEKVAKAVILGRSVAIHCRASIGRAPLVTAALLRHLNVEAEDALNMLAEARRAEVPQTEAQRQWILSYKPGN